MLISDWSSDVCSSDLWKSTILWQPIWVISIIPTLRQMRLTSPQCQIYYQRIPRWKHCIRTFLAKNVMNRFLHDQQHNISLKCQIGRASCRERVCQYV